MYFPRAVNTFFRYARWIEPIFAAAEERGLQTAGLTSGA
jgi:hypothetical protein